MVIKNVFTVCTYLFLEIGSGHKDKSVGYSFINLLSLRVNHHLVFVSTLIFSHRQVTVLQDNFQFFSLGSSLCPFCGILRRYVEMMPSLMTKWKEAL